MTRVEGWMFEDGGELRPDRLWRRDGLVLAVASRRKTAPSSVFPSEFETPITWTVHAPRCYPRTVKELEAASAAEVAALADARWPTAPFAPDPFPGMAVLYDGGTWMIAAAYATRLAVNPALIGSAAWRIALVPMRDAADPRAHRPAAIEIPQRVWPFGFLILDPGEATKETSPP